MLSHLPFLLFYRKGRLGQLHGTCNMRCYCTTVIHSSMVVIDRAVSIFDLKAFLFMVWLFSQIYDFLLEFCITSILLIYLLKYKLDILFLPCFSIISLSQWFVQRYIQVTSNYGMLLVSYFVLWHPEREVLKTRLLKWLV